MREIGRMKLKSWSDWVPRESVKRRAVQNPSTKTFMNDDKDEALHLQTEEVLG